jgi:hypothetical protein
MVLIFDEEDDHTLIQSVLFRGHGMVGMGQHARLEDGRQILRCHTVLIRLGRKHGEEIEDVQQQLSVQRRQLRDQLLVSRNGSVHVEILNEPGALSIGRAWLGGPP